MKQMQKKLMWFSLLFILTIPWVSSRGQEKGTGLGIILGEPTGVSFKQWLTKTTAVDAGFAWSFAKGEDAFHIHVDYLVHHFDWIQSTDELANRLNFYLGLGGRAKFQTDARIGARGVIGLVYFFKGVPLDAFLEVAPILDLAPDTDFSLNGGIGVRYFFSSAKRK